MKNSTIAIAILLVTIVIGSLLAFFYLKKNDTLSDDETIIKKVRNASIAHENSRKEDAREAFMNILRKEDGEDFDQVAADAEFNAMYQTAESEFKPALDTEIVKAEAMAIAELTEVTVQNNDNTQPVMNSLSSGFPERWGEPPSIQTRDIVEFPEEWRQYGWGMINRRGSSTKRNWIQENVDKDKEAIRSGTFVPSPV